MCSVNRMPIILTCLWAPQCNVFTISYKSFNSVTFFPNMLPLPSPPSWGEKPLHSLPASVKLKKIEQATKQDSLFLPQSLVWFGTWERGNSIELAEAKNVIYWMRWGVSCDCGGFSWWPAGHWDAAMNGIGTAHPWCWQWCGELRHWPKWSQQSPKPTQLSGGNLEISHEKQKQTTNQAKLPGSSPGLNSSLPSAPSQSTYKCLTE